jgi:predicted nucleic-acid-binding protein
MSDEEDCRLKLERAERRHREAVKAHLETIVNGADEAATVAAEQRRTAAREEYYRALRAFSDMVIRGKRPGKSST